MLEIFFKYFYSIVVFILRVSTRFFYSVICYYYFTFFSYVALFFKEMAEIFYQANKYLLSLLSPQLVQLDVDDLEYAFTIYSNFIFELVNYFKRVFYFLVFFLPFTYFVFAGASNEYLLFSSILFTLFILYNAISKFLESMLSSQIDSIRALLSKKLSLIVAISKYEQSIVDSNKQSLLILEELIAYILQMENDLLEYEESMYDSILIESLNESLYSYALYEASEELTDGFFIFDDSFETALDDFIEEAFADDNQVE